MLVCDLCYSTEHETLCLLFEHNDDVTSFNNITRVLTENCNQRILFNERKLSQPYNYMHSVRGAYYNTIINDYKRLLVALEYSYNMRDLCDIDYLSLDTRVVHMIE